MRRNPDMRTPATTLAAAGLLVAALGASADVLHSNGPIITNPTGGTGNIAGLPISNADGFMVPGSTFVFSTTGVAATHATSTAAAENFVVPADSGGWDLSTVTLYAFQTSQTTPTIQNIRINLWTAAPYSAGSPGPLPEPLPAPVLAEPLVLSAGPGTFICHRQSATSTSTVRPVFAYTVSLDGLPNGGVLPPGEYWLEWSFEGALSPSANVFMPLVSPRTAVTGHNARLLNSIDGSSGGPRVWFEGREGYVAGQAEGRAYELPFELQGTVLPVGGCAADWNGDQVVNSNDISAYLTAWLTSVQGGTLEADFNDDGAVNSNDISAFLTAWLAAVQMGC
jgi:hypothetical protein